MRLYSQAAQHSLQHHAILWAAPLHATHVLIGFLLIFEAGLSMRSTQPETGHAMLDGRV